MDTTPLSGVDELDEHLDELLQDDQLPLNAKLFDNVQLQLTGQIEISFLFPIHSLLALSLIHI